MQEATAFELTAEYAGTVKIGEGKAAEDVPKYQPGELAIGDSFIDVAEALEAGQGVVVVSTRDQPLLDLFDAYPPFKRGKSPDGPAYDRQGDRVLRRLARLRGLNVQTKERKDVIAALENADKAEARQAAAVAASNR